MLEELYDRCNTKSILNDETRVNCVLPRHLAIKLTPKAWNLSRFFPSASSSSSSSSSSNNANNNTTSTTTPASSSTTAATTTTTSSSHYSARLSLWRSASERLSEDYYINLDKEEEELIFNLSRYYVSDVTSFYLYLDAYDVQRGIPLAIGSVKITLDPIVDSEISLNDDANNETATAGTTNRTKNTGDTVDLSVLGFAKNISVVLRSNTVIRGLKETISKMEGNPITIDVQLKVNSTMTSITYKDIHEVSSKLRTSSNCNLLRPFPQRMLDTMQELYLPTDRIHLSVEDLQLNKDILEFYKNRPIMVRVRGITNINNPFSSHPTSMLYLGSISNLQGIWLEFNELTTVTPCEALDVEVVTLAAVDNAVTPVSSGKSELGYSLEEYVICKGRLSLQDHINGKKSGKESAVLLGGSYETYLHTEIHSVRSNIQNSISKVQVGKIHIRLQCDDLQDISREERYQKVEVKKFKEFLESDDVAKGDTNLDKLFTLVSSCCNLIKSHNLNGKVGNLQQFVQYLDLAFGKVDLRDDSVFDLLALQTIQQSTESNLWYGFSVYFQEWLTSDIVQHLLQISKETNYGTTKFSKSIHHFIQEENERIISVQKALVCLTWNERLHYFQPDEFRGIDAEHHLSDTFVAEICEDLFCVVCQYRSQLIAHALDQLNDDGDELQETECLALLTWFEHTITISLFIQRYFDSFNKLMVKSLVELQIQSHKFIEHVLDKIVPFLNGPKVESYRERIILQLQQYVFASVHELLMFVRKIGSMPVQPKELRVNSKAMHPAIVAIDEMIPSIRSTLQLVALLQQLTIKFAKNYPPIIQGYWNIVLSLKVVCGLLIRTYGKHFIFPMRINPQHDEHMVENAAMLDICDKLTEVSRGDEKDDNGKANPMMMTSQDFHPKQTPRKSVFQPTFEDAMDSSKNNKNRQERSGFGPIDILLVNHGEDAPTTPYQPKFTFVAKTQDKSGEIMNMLNSKTEHHSFLESKHSDEEDFINNATGLTTLVFIKQTSPIISALYDFVLYLLEAQDALDLLSFKSSLIDTKAVVLLLKDLVLCMTENIANTNDWNPSVMKKLFLGYFYGPESMKFSTDMKYGLSAFASIACSVDQLYFAFLQSTLDTNIDKIQQSVKKDKGSSGKKRDFGSYNLVLIENSASSLIYYHGLASIIYDVNQIRGDFVKDSLSLDLLPPNIVLNDEEENSVVIRRYDCKLRRGLQLQNTTSDSLIQLRIGLLTTMKGCFQFYWNALQYNGHVLFQQESSFTEQWEAANVFAKRVKVQDVIERSRSKVQQYVSIHLSALEAILSIIRTVIGVKYLLKGERNGSLLTVVDGMFGIPYLRFCLKLSLDILCLSYAMPSISDHRSTMDGLEDYLFQENDEMSSMYSRISKLRIGIICMVLEIVLLVPVAYPTSPTDTLSAHVVGLSSGEDDWRTSRSTVLFQYMQGFLFNISYQVLQEKQWKVPTILNPEHSPFQSNKLTQKEFSEDYDREGFKVDLDLLLCDVLQMIMIVHHQNVNKVDKITKMYTSLVSSMKALNLFSQFYQTQPVAKDNSKELTKSTKQRHGMDKLLVHSSLTSLLFTALRSMTSDNVSQQLLCPGIDRSRTVVYQELKRMVEDSNKDSKCDEGNKSHFEPHLDDNYWLKYIGISHHAFCALAIFMLDYHQHHGCSTDISDLSDRQKEKEVQHLRDCLSQLMSSGYWEIGLQLAIWYQRNLKEAAAKINTESHSTSLVSPINSPLTSQHISRMGMKLDTPLSMGTLSPKRIRSPMKLNPSHHLLSPATPYATTSSHFIAPPHVSPKRLDTINNELSRIISKFKEKLKFDGNVRLPTRYYAIRFISNMPLVLGNDSVIGKLQATGPVSIVRVHSVNITNLMEADAAGSNSSPVWYEQWCVVRFDFSASMATAEFYQAYVEELQLVLKQQKKQGDGMLPDLSCPVAFQVICQQIKSSFPEFTVISQEQDINQLQDFAMLFRERFPQVYGEKSITSSKKYIQVFQVFTKHICDQVFESHHFIDIKERDPVYGPADGDDEEDMEAAGDRDEDASNNKSDLDEALKLKPFDVLADLQSNVFESKSLKPHLDLKFLHYTEFPTEFYVFAPQRVDGERAITKLHLSVDNVKFPLALLLTGDDSCATDDLALTVTSLAMSPLMTAIHVKSEHISVVESCLEVLLHHAVYLDRMHRAALHLNDLKATEIQNQPDQSILHTDCIFYHCFDLLSNILAQPSTTCVGIHNVDFILICEKEKIDVKWQTVRKHAKREYMRLLSQYEDSLDSKANALTSTGDHHVLGGAYGKKSTERNIKKPEEPNLERMKATFDKEAGLELLEYLQIVRNHIMKKIACIIKEMKRFAEKISATKPPTTGVVTQTDARDFARQKGRLSVTMMANLRINQWAQQLDSAAEKAEPDSPDDDIFPLDDESSLKLKLCLFLEAEYAGIEIGLSL